VAGRGSWLAGWRGAGWGVRDDPAVATRTPPPLALAYHGVADVPLRDDEHRLFVRPRDLDRQLTTLRRWGYELVTFGAWAELVAADAAAGHATLTFDDGYADNLHALVPVLRAHGATATVFVVSSWLGEAHPVTPWTPILSADELRRLHAVGVEIGGHTATHPDLVTLAGDAQRAELERGRRELEAVLDAPVRVAAYPYGHADATTRAACRDAGFVAACRASAEGSLSDPFDLPRQDMDNRCSALGLWLKRDDRYEPLAQTLPGRIIRRLRRETLARAGR